MTEDKKFTYEGKEFTVAYGLSHESASSYGDFVELMNPADIKWIHGTSGDYQGDWMSVGCDATGEWWLVEGSFGSCSGCDWLQGISTEEEAIGFLAAMKKRASIGNSTDQARNYLLITRANAHSSGIEAIDQLLTKMEGT